MEMELEGIFEKYELTGEQYEAFRGSFTLKQFHAGDVVFREGDLAETFYFIRSGELTAARLSSDRQEKVLKVLGPGELFGEIGLLQDVPRIATIKAITDAQIYELGKADFFNLLESNPAFSALLDRLRTLRMLQGIPVFRKLDDESLFKIREELTLKEYQAGRRWSVKVMRRMRCTWSSREMPGRFPAGRRATKLPPAICARGHMSVHADC